MLDQNGKIMVQAKVNNRIPAHLSIAAYESLLNCLLLHDSSYSWPTLITGYIIVVSGLADDKAPLNF